MHTKIQCIPPTAQSLNSDLVWAIDRIENQTKKGTSVTIAQYSQPSPNCEETGVSLLVKKEMTELSKYVSVKARDSAQQGKESEIIEAVYFSKEKTWESALILT